MAAAKGYSRMRERIDSIPGQLREVLAKPPPPLPPDLADKGLVATGVGSSEAAARYVVFLLQQAGVRAVFWPQSVFYGSLPTLTGPSPYLAVFSQGLSPNAQMVLARRQLFAGTLLVTAATVEGQRRAGKESRAILLEQLTNEGATLAVHPMENEYEILPRFVGPVCSMWMAGLLVEGLFSGVRLGSHLLNKFFCEDHHLSESEMDAWGTDLRSGANFFFTNSTSQYAQNLSCKILETLFRPSPGLYDALTYAHGPFQLDYANKGANWIFCTEDPNEQQLVETLTPLFKRGGSCRVITSPVALPHAIFYYEAFLNSLLVHTLKTLDVDLVDWPGKGLDGEGYEIWKPGDTLHTSPIRTVGI